MNDTKSPFASIGIMGPLASLAVWLINKKYPGLGVDEATVGTVVDQGAIFVGSLTAIYGRWKATKAIKAGA